MALTLTTTGLRLSLRTVHGQPFVDRYLNDITTRQVMHMISAHYLKAALRRLLLLFLPSLFISFRFLYLELPIVQVVALLHACLYLD